MFLCSFSKNKHTNCVKVKVIKIPEESNLYPPSLFRTEYKHNHEIWSRFDMSLNSKPTIHQFLLHQHCTLTVQSSVFSWISGVTGGHFDHLLPLKCFNPCLLQSVSQLSLSLSRFDFGIVVYVHNKMTDSSQQRSSRKSVSVVLLWLTFPGLQNRLHKVPDAFSCFRGLMLHLPN